MIAIIDYGVGNLFSLKSSLAAIGREAVVTGDRAVLRAASHVILPGVGAFGDAAARLRAAGMAEAVLEAAAAGKPVLGICLGMQLLLERSFEYGEHPGLGLIPGDRQSSATTRKLGVAPSLAPSRSTVWSQAAPAASNSLAWSRGSSR